MMLEFAVETTFPADESIITAIILISSSLQGVGIMEVDDLLIKEFKPGELEGMGINVILNMRQNHWPRL